MTIDIRNPFSEVEVVGSLRFVQFAQVGTQDRALVLLVALEVELDVAGAMAEVLTAPLEVTYFKFQTEICVSVVWYVLLVAETEAGRDVPSSFPMMVFRSIQASMRSPASFGSLPARMEPSSTRRSSAFTWKDIVNMWESRKWNQVAG